LILDKSPEHEGVVKISLGIWAFGPMKTRFVPGGYKPEQADAVRAYEIAYAALGA
jgi:hypothetical protein